MKLKILIAPLLILPIISSAENRLLPEQPKFSVEDLNQDAARWGVEPNSRHILRMEGSQPKNNWSQKLSKLSPTEHLKGEDGVPFASPEELKSRVKPITITDSQVKEVARLMSQQAAKQLKAYDQIELLEECEKNQTIKKEISKITNQSAKQPELDLLFIAANAVPIDYEEIFGEFVQIIPYDGTNSKGSQIFASSMQIKCLPTRIRKTKRYFFTDTGKNALRNYQKDYHSKGNLHPFYR